MQWLDLNKSPKLEWHIIDLGVQEKNITRYKIVHDEDKAAAIIESGYVNSNYIGKIVESCKTYLEVSNKLEQLQLIENITNETNTQLIMSPDLSDI